MLKLKRLKIHRYRTLKAGTELHFSDGINVLLGKNGTGKTTLLNLLAMVVSGNFYEAREEELEIEFDLFRAQIPGFLSVHLSNKKDSASPISGVSAYKSDFEIIYYSDSFGREREFTIKTRDENSLVTKFDKTQKEISAKNNSFSNPFSDIQFNFINFTTWKLDEYTLFQLYLLPNSMYRLDEARDWLLSAIKANNILLTFKQKGNSTRIDSLLPSDIGFAFRNIFNSNRESISMVADSQSISSLQQIVSALGYEKAQVILEQLNADKDQVSFGNPRFHFTKRDGTSVRLEQLSFGEQRLFAFYYYLACTEQVVIADELTNGLHHEMISGCIAAIGERQAFLATQNPLLLEHLFFESVEQVRSTFIVSRLENIDGSAQMVWRNLTEDESDMFYRAYKVGIEHVGEILRTRGLW